MTRNYELYNYCLQCSEDAHVTEKTHRQHRKFPKLFIKCPNCHIKLRTVARHRKRC